MEGNKVYYKVHFGIEGTSITWRLMRRFTRQLTPSQLEKLSCGQPCRLTCTDAHSVTQIMVEGGCVEFISHTDVSDFEIKVNYQDAKDALLKFRESVNFDNSAQVTEFSYLHPYLTITDFKAPEAKQWRLDHSWGKQIEYSTDKRLESFSVATGENGQNGDWLHFTVLEDQIEMEVNNYRYYFDRKSFMLTMMKILEDETR